MIKVKLVNPVKGRNEPTFRPFLLAQDLFAEIGVTFTESDDYDFAFIGMADFIDRKVSLEESIQKGVEFVKGFGDKCFLFDGSDSTSLLGAYEVLAQTDARYLFKNQLLKERTTYSIPTPFNKCFFLGECELDIGYDISEEVWSRIKLSGYNLGSLLPHYRTHYNYSPDKPYDVCAIYQAYHPENYDHGVRNDTFYTQHRTAAWEQLKQMDNFSILMDKLPKEEYLEKMWKSKVALSPFGMGEVCFRDFELMQFGTIMIKPSMEHVQTHPNPYVRGVTYIPAKHDWSDLYDILLQVVDDADNCQQMVHNMRKKFLEEYTPENFVRYWYNIFKEQPEVQ